MFEIHAPAKVNLYLHVAAPRADGRHPLDSLVVFADAGASDRLRFEPGGTGLDFQVTNLSDGVDIGPPEANLVVRAVRALENHTGKLISGRLTLEKRLPIAAGIGGGSSDAAAALHLVNGALGLGLSVETLIELAKPLGGDVPACVAGKPVLMRGDGDRIEPVGHDIPVFQAVLICPDIACPTGAVFRAFDAAAAGGNFSEMAPPDGQDAASFLTALTKGYRNDLEAAALSLFAHIGVVLNQLKNLSGVQFAAMSGSGATCFALFEAKTEANNAVHLLKQAFPESWVARTELGKAGFDPKGFRL